MSGFRKGGIELEQKSVLPSSADTTKRVLALDTTNTLQLIDNLGNATPVGTGGSSSISGAYVSTVNTISGGVLVVGGSNIAISQTGQTITVAISGVVTSLNSQVVCNTSTNLYQVTHASITGASYPLASLVVPNSGSILFISGIYATSISGFNVVLSGVPSVTGYFINWQRTTIGSVGSGGSGGSGSISVSNGTTTVNNVTTLNITGRGIGNLASAGGGSVTLTVGNYGVQSFTVSSGNIVTPTTVDLNASVYTSADVSLQGYGKIDLPTNMQNGQSINILMTQDAAPYMWGMVYDTNIEFPQGVPVIPSSGNASTTVVTLLKMRNRYFATGLTEFI